MRVSELRELLKNVPGDALVGIFYDKEMLKDYGGRNYTFVNGIHYDIDVTVRSSDLVLAPLRRKISKQKFGNSDITVSSDPVSRTLPDGIGGNNG